MLLLDLVAVALPYLHYFLDVNLAMGVVGNGVSVVNDGVDAVILIQQEM
tara:strand:+ start:596 stop:742 length:147 start_codon:yes stop_codon:yes gene_type:complete